LPVPQVRQEPSRRCFRNTWKTGFDRDNPVRAIDAFVEKLDLSRLSFAGVAPAATGRPSYHPSGLLKLYIYGYLNRVQSSRRLEREAARNVEVMWPTCRLIPDHKTIVDFRKDNGLWIKRVRWMNACFLGQAWSRSYRAGNYLLVPGG
jgi:hypothetical protein